LTNKDKQFCGERPSKTYDGNVPIIVAIELLRVVAMILLPIAPPFIKQPTFHQLRSVEQLGYITVLMQRSVNLEHP
jgi:secreted Zn-dependent insulinase-like peptidase